MVNIYMGAVLFALYYLRENYVLSLQNHHDSEKAGNPYSSGTDVSDSYYAAWLTGAEWL